jgi:ferrous iron transport protein B
MEARFDGRAGAFAYLLFVLLYFPCVATIGVIVREAGAPWAAFVAGWTTSVAFATATLFYQVATFERHPIASGAWVVGLLVALGVVLLGLRAWAHNGRGGEPGVRVAGVRV